jgi:hypothetical protein
MTMRRHVLGAAVIVLVVWPFYSPSSSWAADWSLSPSASLTGQYNDNILFSEEGTELEDEVGYGTFRVEAAYDTDRFRAALNSGVQGESYVDYDEYNTLDHDHRLGVSYGVSRNLEVRAGGFFREDTTQETELLEEGLLVRREDRQKFGGNAGFDYDFTRQLSLSADWTRRYSKYYGESTDFDDRTSDTIELSPQYMLSPKTKLFLPLRFEDTEYDRPGDPDIKNYSVRPSFRHDFAEDFYIMAGAGYRHTDDNSPPDETETDGFVFNIDFHKKWKRATAALLASRDQYASVDEGNVERDRITIRGSFNLTERLYTSVSATYRQNRVEDEPQDDNQYYSVTPAIGYALTPTVTLQASVDYSEYNYDDNPTEDRDQFRAGLTLTSTWPRLFSNH